MNKEFKDVLIQFRKEAGYQSGYAFFHKNGGQRVFFMGYNHYMNIERGDTLPRPRAMAAIAGMLLLVHKEGKLREFFLAYLRSAWGEEIFRFIVTPSMAPAREGRSRHPLGAAIAGIHSLKDMALSAEQSTTILESFANYWTFVSLSNDKKAWSPPELSRALGIHEEEIRKSLKRLVQVKLLKQNKDGSYLCPHTGACFLHPRPGARSLLPRNFEQTQEYWGAMQKAKGALFYHRNMTLRASESDFMNYIPYLTQAVFGSNIYAAYEKGPDTAFFTVEGTIRKLCPF